MTDAVLVQEPLEDETAPLRTAASDVPARPGRVLVVGASGAFGSRLAAGLVTTSALPLTLAGRRREPLEALAARLRGLREGADVEVVLIDRTKAGPDEVAATGAFVTVDAAGPFQGDDLGFAVAVIAARSHYVDLSDARDFAANFPVLDEQAKAAGVVAVTGASTTPAVTAAALRKITDGWRSVDRVEITVAPGDAAARGLSVVKAILSYAGRPVTVVEDGVWRSRPGWGLTRRVHVPGLGSRWASLCDTPDLDVVPAMRPEVRTVLFRAGSEMTLSHIGLLALSLPVRIGIVRDLSWLSRPLKALQNLLAPFGTEDGGMTVVATGKDARGLDAVAQWTLVARDGDGPFVPTLPALSIVKAMAEARPTPEEAGAVAAWTVYDGEMLAEEAKRLRISTSIARTSPRASSVFERTLGPAFTFLPTAVKKVHAPPEAEAFEGEAGVVGPETGMGRIVGRMFGFPAGEGKVEAVVTISPEVGREVWTRRIGETTFRSRMAPGRAPGHVTEAFGPFRFDLRFVQEPNGFRLEVEGWRFLKVPLPRALAPRTKARGFAAENGRYGFDVTIAVPGLGRLVSYKGDLSTEPATVG